MTTEVQFGLHMHMCRYKVQVCVYWRERGKESEKYTNSEKYFSELLSLFIILEYSVATPFSINHFVEETLA